MLHVVLVAGFLAVTTLLLFVVVANRLRIRNVLLSWRIGRPFAFPVAPSLFVLVVLGLFGYTVFFEEEILSPLLLAGYLAGGTFWFLAGLFSASFVVTDCGILRHTNRTVLALGWGQVVDYFEVARGKQHEYVFFLLDPARGRQRFEVRVPAVLRDRFQEILELRLDRRFDLSVEEAMGNKALES